jgi:S1-C subfamily serine protease
LVGLGYPDAAITLVPTGIITARNALVNDKLKPWWQTDLALNGGVRGGPIFGSHGTVVGVAEVMRGDNAQLISFVIPIQFASDLRLKRILSAASTIPSFFKERRQRGEEQK